MLGVAQMYSLLRVACLGLLRCSGADTPIDVSHFVRLEEKLSIVLNGVLQSIEF